MVAHRPSLLQRLFTSLGDRMTYNRSSLNAGTLVSLSVITLSLLCSEYCSILVSYDCLAKCESRENIFKSIHDMIRAAQSLNTSVIPHSQVFWTTSVFITKELSRQLADCKKKSQTIRHRQNLSTTQLLKKKNCNKTNK